MQSTKCVACNRTGLRDHRCKCPLRTIVLNGERRVQRTLVNSKPSFGANSIVTESLKSEFNDSSVSHMVTNQSLEGPTSSLFISSLTSLQNACQSDSVTIPQLTEEIRFVSYQIRKLLAGEKRIISLLSQLCAAFGTPTASTSTTVKPALRLLKTNEEMDILESSLSDENKFDSFVHTISSIGGADLSDVVRRILQSLVHNDLAKTINWKGTNGKRNFSSMRLASAIKAAVSCNVRLENITHESIEKRIQRWFQNAPDRDGGRNQRRLKKQTN
ncbi:hypothetical protein AHF37_06576 [Paragonimus kellicotti]|nr:hypothetical protein AHF37_06576 [Paragonimus kellicotti]